MIGATPLIKPRKNGNVQRVIELHAKGMSAGRIATKLGIERKTVQSYLKIYAHTDSLDSSDDGPHCRCGLRLFGDEEIPGQCNRCLPVSAAGMLGRNGEPAAVTWTPRAFRG